MPRERNLVAAALTLALGGTLTYTAIKNKEALVIGTVKKAIDYDKKVADETIHQTFQKIRGHRVYMDGRLAEILSEPNTEWTETNTSPFATYVNPAIFRVECRPSSIGKELLITRTYSDPTPNAADPWAVSKEARVDYWIIGRRLDPATIRKLISG